VHLEHKLKSVFLTVCEGWLHYTASRLFQEHDSWLSNTDILQPRTAGTRPCWC